MQKLIGFLSTENKLSKGDHLVSVLFFLVFAITITWPLVLNMGSAAQGDGNIYLHSFWLFRKAILSFSNPFYTDFIFYPQGASLVFNGGVFSSFLLTLPVNLIWGVPEAINASHLVSFTLCGYFTFLLALDITGSRAAAIISGVIYALFPYHLNHFPAQLNLSELHWIPAYIFLLKRTVEKQEMKWPLCAGVVVILAMLTDSIQTVIMIIMSVIILSSLCIHNKAWQDALLFRKLVLRLSIIAVTAMLVGSPYLVQVAAFLKESRGSLIVNPFDRGGANSMSADLAGFIAPPSPSPLSKIIFPAAEERWRNNMYVGYATLLLAMIGFIRHRNAQWPRILLLTTLAGFILSLGTSLHCNGQVTDASGNPLLMPFAYIANLPLFAEVRTPYRFHIITALSLSCLAGTGVSSLVASRKSGMHTAFIICIICVAVLVEFFPGLRDFQYMPKTPGIYRKMAQDGESYSVLQLPLSRWSALERFGPGSPHYLQSLQMVHGKKIFGGHVARTSAKSLDPGDEVLRSIINLNAMERFEIFEKNRLPTRTEYDETKVMAKVMKTLNPDFVKKYRLGYVVLHDHAARKGSLSRLFVEEFFDGRLTEEPSEHIAYIKLKGI